MDINQTTQPISEAELDARVEAVIAEKKRRLKRKQIFSAIMIAVQLLVIAVIIVTVVTTAKGERFWLFGAVSFSVVATDSMTPTIKVGDFTVIQKCEIEDVNTGDIIVFIGGNSFGALKGEHICHRVVERQESDGKIYLRTQGDKPGANIDLEPITKENLVGKCTYSSSVLGGIHKFLSNAINWIFIAATIALIWLTQKTIRKVTKKKS